MHIPPLTDNDDSEDDYDEDYLPQEAHLVQEGPPALVRFTPSQTSTVSGTHVNIPKNKTVVKKVEFWKIL